MAYSTGLLIFAHTRIISVHTAFRINFKGQIEILLIQIFI